MNFKKKITAAALSFAYVMTAAMPVLAADTEIYMQAVEVNRSASPTLMLSLDTSGNMVLCMDSDASCVDSQNVGGRSRMGQMKLALLDVLDSVPDHVKLGLVKYISANDTGASGMSANVQFPARPLGQELGDYMVDTQSSTAMVLNAVDDLELESGLIVETTETSDKTARLELAGANNVVMLRFTNLGISQGAQIQSAILEAQVMAGNNAPALKVSVYDAVNVPAFCSASITVDSRRCTPPATSDFAQVYATITPTLSTVGQGNNRTTIMRVDLRDAVQRMVSKADWRRGQPLALMIQAAGATSNFAIRSRNDSGNISLQVQARTEPRPNTVRDELKAWISGVTAAANDNSAGPLAYIEMTRYLVGAQVTSSPLSQTHRSAYDATTLRYHSPLVDAAQSCAADYMVMMTSGEPNNASGVDNNGGRLKTNDTSSSSCGIGTALTNPKAAWTCMFDLARWTSEQRSGVFSKSIRTSTVVFRPAIHQGGGLDQDMMKLSQMYGGGEHYYATSAADLAMSFKDIINRLLSQGASMVAPGVAVNQLNRAEHLDQIFYGVFKPTTTARWPGNFKRYRLQQLSTDLDGLQQRNSNVLDKNDLDAIDPVTRYFKQTATSYWSTSADGSHATAGGAANRQSLPRNVLFGNDMQPMVSATVVDGVVTGSRVHADLAAYDESDMRWISGIDVDDENVDGSTTDARRSMGAPLHAQPTLVNYSTSDNDNMVAFISTNDGLLHSINTSDGSENWAWMPSELLRNVADLRANREGVDRPIYGLDSTWTVFSRSGSHWIYGGMGDGGRNYYGLNVSSKTSPRLGWSILGGSSTGFERLGYSWSKPVLTRVRVSVGAGETASSEIKDVLIFGGGYDQRYESTSYITPSGDVDLGNAIYMVDARSGALLWGASGSASGSSRIQRVSDMRFSVPGGLRVLDKNGDGLVDHIYFADLGGQVFRVDVNNMSSAPSLIKRVRTMAKLGITESATSATLENSRRFYEMPGAAYVTENVVNPVTGLTEERIYAALALGSGYRSRPLSRLNTERFYMIKDYDAARFDILDNAHMNEAGESTAGEGMHLAALVTTADLADVSTVMFDAATAAVADARGWYITLPGDGEKVLSAAFIYQGDIYFNTFLPATASASSCSPVQGYTNAWRIRLSNGSPVVDFDRTGSVDNLTDRYSDFAASGIAGDTVLVITPDEEGQRVACALTGTSCEVASDPPAGFGRIMRTRWFDRH